MSHEEKVALIVERLGTKYFSRINEKTDEQLDYVLSSISENIFLKACPGSGKTEVVGLKAAYEMNNWKRKPAGIAVLTFTNNAADVISERVTQFIGNDKATYPHYMGTIDSWLYKYLMQPFFGKPLLYQGEKGDYSMRLVENTSSNSFLYSFRTKYGINMLGNILANQYYFNYEKRRIIFCSGIQELDHLRNSYQLEDYQVVDLKTTKKKFWSAGLCSYQDAEQLCYKSLNHNELLRNRLSSRFPLILLDECQDLSTIQLMILKCLMQAGTILHIIGDLNQSIYEFKKVEPKNVEDFVIGNKYRVKYLTDNYRSCQKIVDTCSKIVNENSMIGKENELVAESCVYFTFKKEEISNLIEVFQKYLESKEIPLDKSVIITRSWKNVDRLRNIKQDEKNRYQYQFATAIYLWQRRDKVSREKSIKLLGRFISKKYFDKYSVNSQQYFCPECVNSAIKWRIFIASILNSIYESKSPIINQNQTWSDWSKLVKSELLSIAKNCINILTDNTAPEIIEEMILDKCKFDIPRKEGSNNVLQSITTSEPSPTKLLITTIHSVKGQTFNAVLVVSSPSQSGTTDGHWKDWLENPNSEAARLAYVASSRPKYLLAWAIPEPSESDIKRIEEFGFKNYATE
jgi:DNA helicase II / ATP-dependent DNA helicase PcrA